MYTVSRPYCIHDEGSERIQKKHYSEISMAVLIHFTVQDFHTICNAKLFSLIDTGWLTIKAEEKYLKNHPEFCDSKGNLTHWNLAIIVFKVSVKWGMLKDSNIYIYI